ncbi:hypothetical protein NIES4074_27140 [Cylindrospermum sp. NIES-4074]|nr:hypothetical protein NIES4074_27140 [Cylindrospermum sp. NIES-4074]
MLLLSLPVLLQQTLSLLAINIPNQSGSESGSVTGVIVLPDANPIGTTSNAASSITINSAPGVLASFNGLQLVGNPNFSGGSNSFDYTSTAIQVVDFIAISVANNNFGSNFLSFRLRLGDSSFPLNFLAASTSSDLFANASGNSLRSPSVIGNDSSVIYTVVPSADVPFDIPGGAAIPSFGGLFALGIIRKVRKNIASKTLSSTL